MKRREITGSGKLRPRLSFEDVVAIIECLREEPYAVFMSLRGDWAKPLLLWALRRYSGMTLREIGEAVGGMDYTAVAMAVKRFEKKAEKQEDLREWIRVSKMMCER